MKPIHTALSSVWLVPVLAVALAAAATTLIIAWPLIPFALYYMERNRMP